MLQYAIDQALAGEWKPGYKAFGLAMGPQACGDGRLQRRRRRSSRRWMEAEQAIREGKIKALEG